MASIMQVNKSGFWTLKTQDADGKDKRIKLRRFTANEPKRPIPDDVLVLARKTGRFETTSSAFTVGTPKATADDTKGFWSGKSEPEMWKELRNEWFGPDAKVLETCPILDMKSRTTFRNKMVLRLRSLTPEADAYLAAFSWQDTMVGMMEDKRMTTD